MHEIRAEVTTGNFHQTGSIIYKPINPVCAGWPYTLFANISTWLKIWSQFSQLFCEQVVYLTCIFSGPFLHPFPTKPKETTWLECVKKCLFKKNKISWVLLPNEQILSSSFRKWELEIHGLSPLKSTYNCCSLLHFGKENNCRIWLLMVLTSPFFPQAGSYSHAWH